MIRIGTYTLDSRTVLAPMAGVTDQPFRNLCRRFGAALTPSEMLTSNVRLWHHDKNRLRRCHDGDAEPRVVQIAGADPVMMAEAARLNVEEGAQIIDINMGCPAKKVLRRSAGSALLQYPGLVREILEAVTMAVAVPVTLKIRTGWDVEHRNGTEIARIAEDCGIRSLAVHGRTRACAFRGEAEYDTIAAIKQAVGIPVFANGDICTPQQARHVLDHTGADGLMIGRAAQGRPWLFAEINHYLDTGVELPGRTLAQVMAVLREHVAGLHAFYGMDKGVFFARKHTGWYLANLDPALVAGSASQHEAAALVHTLRQQFNRLQVATAQTDFLEVIFQSLAGQQQKQAMKDMAA